MERKKGVQERERENEREKRKEREKEREKRVTWIGGHPKKEFPRTREERRIGAESAHSVEAKCHNYSP